MPFLFRKRNNGIFCSRTFFPPILVLNRKERKEVLDDPSGVVPINSSIKIIMSHFLAIAIQDNQPTIPDNQSMLNSNGAGAVSKLITARCNVDVTARCNDDITKMDGVTPLLNLLSLFAHCPSHQIPLCFSRMSMLGNRILFVQHMSKLSCVQQTPT